VDGQASDGPLAGVPYAVKDLAVACAGLPFTCGSRIFGDFVPDYDSAAAARPKGAGMTIVGNTRSPEFGLLPVTEPSRFGAVRNPWNPEYSAGGSSGGAGAAVASGALTLAGASDAAGSIRIPAAYCGLVGLKPSRGRISLAPDMGEHPLACEGVVSRTVADTAAMLDVLSGPEMGDTTWAPPPERPYSEATGGDRPLRVALCLEPPFETPVDASHVAAASRIAGVLSGLGHEVEEATPPWINPAFPEMFASAWFVGAAAFAGWGAQISGLAPGPETLEPLTLAFAGRGSAISAPEYGGLMVGLQGYARAVVSASDAWDVVLSPALAERPPRLGALEDISDPDEGIRRILAMTPYTPVANVTGQPAVSLPAGMADDGMPVAVQLTGRPLGEASLLRLAAELEDAEDWTSRRPPAWEAVSG
jgi:amidase